MFSLTQILSSSPTNDLQGFVTYLYAGLDSKFFCCCCSAMSDSLWPPCTAARQASPSFTTSQSLLKLMSIELMMPSNHLIFCHHFLSCPQAFPASGSFPMSQLFASGAQSSGASALSLPMSIQDWFPLGLTSLISLLSKGLSRAFSSTTVWKHQFFGAQPSLSPNSHIHTWLLLIYHSENPRALKNYAKSTLPALNKWHNKVWMTAHPGFAVDFKSIVETYY